MIRDCTHFIDPPSTLPPTTDSPATNPPTSSGSLLPTPTTNPSKKGQKSSDFVIDVQYVPCRAAADNTAGVAVGVVFALLLVVISVALIVIAFIVTNKRGKTSHSPGKIMNKFASTLNYRLIIRK